VRGRTGRLHGPLLVNHFMLKTNPRGLDRPHFY